MIEDLIKFKRTCEIAAKNDRENLCRWRGKLVNAANPFYSEKLCKWREKVFKWREKFVEMKRKKVIGEKVFSLQLSNFSLHLLFLGCSFKI